MSASSSRWQRDVAIYKQPLVTAPFVFFGLLAIVSLALSAGRLFTGLSFTGMSDDYAWGVWKTFNVMTLTALGSGGLAVGLFAWVFNRRKLHVVMRTALASSLLFYTTGTFALVFDVGRPWNMWAILLPTRWNLHSALFEVAICMTAYAWLFLIYENLPPIFDWLIAKSRPARRPMLKKIYDVLVVAYPYMVAGAYLLPAMHQSSLGSLMVAAGTKVHPLWQTQMLPFLYLVQAINCGFAAVIIILMASCLAWRRPLDMEVLDELGKYLAWTSIFFVVVRYADIIIRGHIGDAFILNGYGILFNLEMVLTAVPAFFLLGTSIRRTPRWLFVFSTVNAVGGLLYRFSPTTFAYHSDRPSLYFPTIPELLMCLGYIGLAVTLFLIAAKRFAILPSTLSDWYSFVKFTKRSNPELRIDDHGAATDY